MPVPARRLPSWAWVSGLTAGAVAAVAVLAVQAGQGTRPTATATVPSPSAFPSARPTAERPPAPPAVPDDSGTGRRIVYSLAERRVWLVDVNDSPRRTFTVWPGTVDPDPGSYTVGTRTDATTGSDGVPVEHVVFFALKSGVNFAFSAAVDGSSPPPAEPGARTGGIRMKSADGSALWTFGSAGTTVTVVD
ncbi:hypothetical protein [Streptomyces cadmiisoli]|uniref:L,D-transpeptidase n=1 Tax=Streptomyces cadmiisoli TaxID=2184053 RepID=A0A2Z4J2E4_9ACTN|nr:hypothetical protein [Streptomyces cadmiisoli]AWW39056.1 hypothetical protein DN051_22350 [Streptomyces cadmiisoli]